MISKRARYALHGVGFLAHHHLTAPVPFADIMSYLRDYSSGTTLSQGYVAKIFQDLSRAHIVVAVPGRNGGYTLAGDPRTVSLADVVIALDGNLDGQCCLLAVTSCSKQDSCGVYDVVQRARRVFYDTLGSQTAASMAVKMFGRRPTRRPAKRRSAVKRAVKRRRQPTRTARRP